jgi:LysR family glycine cleavage system transcriptional activator
MDVSFSLLVVSASRVRPKSEKIAQGFARSSKLPQSLPSLHLIKALLATAQHGNMSRAAEDLHLTPGAVSKQILELEGWLGVALFERVRKQLHLTPSGERYVARLRPLIAQMEEATAALLQETGRPLSLGIATVPAFGAKCLFPHLGDFRRQHPEIELRFVPYVDAYTFDSPELDCAIRWGSGTWPGTRADYVAGHEIVVIAPPAAAGGPVLRTPADIAGHTLLHHVKAPDGWKDWCEANGVRGVNTQAGPKIDMSNSITQAVAGGLGLGLLPRCLLDEEIAAGVVQCPFPPTVIPIAAYYLCCPQAKANEPAVEAFRQWLVGLMAPGAAAGG